MDQKMARCMECGSYSLKKACPDCNEKTAPPHPPRFSPEDKYGKYRRQLKALALEEKKGEPGT